MFLLANKVTIHANITSSLDTRLHKVLILWKMADLDLHCLSLAG